MSVFPPGFNSPAKLSGPCLVKYFVGASVQQLATSSSTYDTIEMCTAGSQNAIAIADQGQQLKCGYSSVFTIDGATATVACGLIALNATLTSNSGTFTLYNTATTDVFTPTSLAIIAAAAGNSAYPAQVLSVTNTASISSFIVQPTSAATVAKIPALFGFIGFITSIFFSGLA